MAKKKETGETNVAANAAKTKGVAANAATPEADAAREKFQERLKELLNLAKKKKNMLEYQEISDFFADMQLDAETVSYTHLTLPTILLV